MGKHNTVIFAAFDVDKFRDAEGFASNINNRSAFPYFNISPASLSFSISSLPPVLDQNSQFLNFTSNGITGLVSPLTSFNLPKINFANQNIYFTSKVESLCGRPNKDLPKLASDQLLLQTHAVGVDEELIYLHNTEFEYLITEDLDLDLSLITQDGTAVPFNQVNFTSNFGILSADLAGGYFKGILNTTFTGENLRIQLIFNSNNFGSISGVSTPFDIYPSEGLYDIRKVGEDNNETQNYENLATQPTLQDQPLFMKQLLGQIVGDSNSSPDTLGIKMHEKIENYVANINDPDYANLRSLNSLITELSMSLDEYNQEFPPSLSRLMDIISISVSKQKGAINQFQGDFDSKGYISREFYGKNRGDKLPIDTTILEIGANSKNILAYEKFSNDYTLVNTNIISATDVNYTTSTSYPLSAYNKTWGWGLVLPIDVLDTSLTDHYEFFDVIETVEGSYLQKFIDYDNPNNTYLTNITSFEQYNEKWGIAENVISHNLYTNLNLISSS